MAAGFYDLLAFVLGWKSAAPPELATVSERYSLIGTNDSAQDLTGADNSKFALIGANDQKFELTGA